VYQVLTDIPKPMSSWLLESWKWNWCTHKWNQNQCQQQWNVECPAGTQRMSARMAGWLAGRMPSVGGGCGVKGAVAFEVLPLLLNWRYYGVVNRS